MKSFSLGIYALFVTACFGQTIPDSALYLGQTPPGNTPKVFQLPISNGLFAAERIAISSDGTEIYYTELNGYPTSVSRIKRFHYKNAKWNGPFVEMSNYMSSALSIDGRRLFYENSNSTSFSSMRSDTTWSTPAIFLNTPQMTHYLQVTNPGNYYLTSNPLISNTGDIAKLLINSGDTTIITLGSPINFANSGFDFFISRDESYIIRVIKSNGIGDLFISYHKADGGWTNPKTLGAQVNTSPGWEWGPYVTNDNKYLFFTRRLSSLNINWVRVDNLIDSLKYTNFVPYVKNPIPNQTAKKGSSFNYQIPDSTFIDDDGNNTLTFTSKLSNGNSLPSWLSFNPSTRTFSGTPIGTGELNVKVIATDTTNASASCTFSLVVVNTQTGNISIDYLGQTPPGDSAIIFAPGKISLESRFEQCIAFSPDGKELVFGVSNSNWNYMSIFIMKYDGSSWSEPIKAPFLGDTDNGLTPIYSYDNSKIFFTSHRPQYPALDIWMSERTETGWKAPVKMGPPINTPSIEFEVSISANNTLYFSSTRPGGIGDQDNYSSKLEDGKYKNAINLGSPINSNKGNDTPFIARDESYLIFASDRVGSYETDKRDLYISYRKNDNTWTNPKNMGSKINTTGYDLFPYVSPDNKYLFFTRRDSWLNSSPSKIYWISASIIDDLKITNYSPYVKNPIPNQTDTAGMVFSYAIPDTIFFDDDGNNTLTYSATLSNGNPLPSWLSFNPGTRTFSGTPTTAGVFPISVKVTATDTANASASSTFGITVVANPVGVEEADDQLPKEWMLFQNYPNPFNPTTTIQYSLSKPSEVKLSINNMLGQRIRTIVDIVQNAGEYSAVWDATDDKNNAVSSGIYFYKLETSNRSESRRFIYCNRTPAKHKVV